MIWYRIINSSTYHIFFKNLLYIMISYNKIRSYIIVTTIPPLLPGTDLFELKLALIDSSFIG